MRIDPVNPTWIHAHILEPLLQAAELMNYAWEEAVDSPKSLKDRVICWLQGFCLALPFANTIIWLAWQTFGKPKRLFDPYCPEIGTPLPPRRVTLHFPAPSTGGLERHIFLEKWKGSSYETHWQILELADRISVRQSSQGTSSSSTYDSQLCLKKYHYSESNQSLTLSLEADHCIRVEFSNVDKPKELKIPEDGLPWIQHPMVGFKKFVLSNQSEMYFYAVVFKDYLREWLPFAEKPPFLMKFHAKKMGSEDQLLKVDVTSTWGWPYNRYTGELWFNSETGILQRFKNPLSDTSGELFPKSSSTSSL